MGKRKTSVSLESLNSSLSSMLVPSDILENFEVYGILEKSNHWEIDLREKTTNIPMSLRSFSDVVLDGFCNKLEVQSNSLAAMKPVYLHCYRRRWKRSNQDKHYSNEYQISIEGVKLVKELGFFLKGKDRRTSR